MERKIKALLQQAIDQAMMSREFYRTMAILVEHPETKETFNYLAKNEESLWPAAMRANATISPAISGPGNG